MGQPLDERVIGLVAEEFGVDASELSREMRLEDLGVDSLDLAGLMLAIDREFGLRIEPVEAASLETLGDLATLIYTEVCASTL